ncbi:unnamed protein product [Lampetra planeri]
MKSLPCWCRGKVVKGFGRGSKQLGIPTANLPEPVVEQLPADVATGIYFGWACVGSGDVHKMVMSIGWNPFYNNTKKSMEVHIIHSFEEDFYGEVLSIVILGYIRAETGFDSLGATTTSLTPFTTTSGRPRVSWTWRSTRPTSKKTSLGAQT